jgi:hypothetical protein
MIEPLSNKPKITTSDIVRGYVPRYFVQHVSLKKITEVDKLQYDSIKNDPMYLTLELKWVITGNSEDSRSIDGTFIRGAKHQNTVSIDWYSKTMHGLERILRNPLEFFVGRRTPGT